MYKAKVNNRPGPELNFAADGTVNGERPDWDLLESGENKFHILKDYRSYNVELLEADYTAKTFLIKVNGNTYTVELKDQYDELLKSLGMDSSAGAKVNELKAPMPGLVVDVRVKEGDEIKKGDPLLALEAMKMENILKSPADARVKKINVVKGDKVEKNQVLINFS